jgi:hypothetical protein
MDIRTKIIQKNIERCQALYHLLTPTEGSMLLRCKFKGVNTQAEFNQLAVVASDVEKRKNKAEAGPESVFDCPICKKKILWISTKRNKKVLIDAHSYHDEPCYNPTKHSSHWNFCDYRCP